VKSNSALIVPISGLKIGNYPFSFRINDTFFDEFSESRDFQGQLMVDLVLLKSETMIQANMNGRGKLYLNCARCNDSLELNQNFSFSHIFKFGSFSETHYDEDISYIPSDTYELDFSQLIYEQIMLSIPLKPLHDEGQCNKEVIKLLDSYIQNNSDKDNIDPRWSALNDLN
jgi:uncharacterized protein